MYLNINTEDKDLEVSQNLYRVISVNNYFSQLALNKILRPIHTLTHDGLTADA